MNGRPEVFWLVLAVIVIAIIVTGSLETPH